VPRGHETVLKTTKESFLFKRRALHRASGSSPPLMASVLLLRSSSTLHRHSLGSKLGGIHVLCSGQRGQHSPLLCDEPADRILREKDQFRVTRPTATLSFGFIPTEINAVLLRLLSSNPFADQSSWTSSSSPSWLIS
jgi:hypothetical protein